MSSRELYSKSDKEEQRDRARARTALLIGGLPEETVVIVEERLGDVDWRTLAAAQDSLFMAAGNALGIRQFWATPRDDGQTPLEAMQTTDAPDHLADSMLEHVRMLQLKRLS